MSPNEVDGKVQIKGLGIERLTIEDYLPWLDAMKSDVKARNDALIPSTMRAEDRYDHLKRNAAYDPSPDDCIPLLWAAWFQIKVIDAALSKTGLSQKTKDLKLTAVESRVAAMKLSGLLTEAQIEEILNPPKPSAQQQANQQTFAKQDRGARPLQVKADLPDETQPPPPGHVGDPPNTFAQK